MQSSRKGGVYLICCLIFFFYNRAAFKYDDKKIVYTGDCGENYDDFVEMCEGILPISIDSIVCGCINAPISLV